MKRVSIVLASLGAAAIAAFMVLIVFVTLDAGSGARAFRNVSGAMDSTLLAGESAYFGEVDQSFRTKSITCFGPW